MHTLKDIARYIDLVLGVATGNGSQYAKTGNGFTKQARHIANKLYPCRDIDVIFLPFCGIESVDGTPKVMR